jgi:hypothetical protein
MSYKVKSRKTKLEKRNSKIQKVKLEKTTLLAITKAKVRIYVSHDRAWPSHSLIKSQMFDSFRVACVSGAAVLLLL